MGTVRSARLAKYAVAVLLASFQLTLMFEPRRRRWDYTTMDQLHLQEDGSTSGAPSTQ
jgi:hypothetical protein